MRVRRWIVIGLLLVALIGILGFWATRRADVTPFEPLGVERRQIGAFRPPPALSGMFKDASLVDFDGDGEPELLAHYQHAGPRGGTVVPQMTFWMSLKDGSVDSTPLLAVLPSDQRSPTAYFPWHAQFQPGELPLLQEVIALDRGAWECFLLRRAEGSWRTEPLAGFKGTRLSYALGTDLDGDGQHDDYLLRTDKGEFLHLHAERNGRLRLERTSKTLPPHLQPIFDRNATLLAWTGLPIVSGTVSVEWKTLSDLDGDGQPEKAYGRRAAPQKSSSAVIYLSRTRRTLALPIGKIDLLSDVEAAEVDGDPQCELVVCNQDFRHLELRVLDWSANGLRAQGAPLRLPRSGIAPHWVRDLDGDGKAEIVVSEILNDGRNIRWTVCQVRDGQLQQVAQHTKRLDASLRRKFPSELHVKRGVIFSVSSTTLLQRLAGRSSEAVIVLSFPEGKDALNPANWQYTTVHDTDLFWAGDYDGDGTEEVLLSSMLFGRGNTYLLQHRDGKWRVAGLRNRNLGAALPARLNGQPCLVLLYTDGVVEVVRVK
ncbi:MAG: VCBS repeat-containing protein [Fimbriimonadales bacterium]|nr:VCBS repeat-containing protein [Fimbriimonadales bacterium]